jgi:hypothetical protein
VAVALQKASFPLATTSAHAHAVTVAIPFAVAVAISNAFAHAHALALRTRVRIRGFLHPRMRCISYCISCLAVSVPRVWLCWVVELDGNSLIINI